MPVRFCVSDDTGAVRRMGLDESGGCDFGAGTPAGALSIDGTIFVTSGGKLGNTRGIPEGVDHVSGSVVINSGSSQSIVTGLTRTPLFIHESLGFVNGVYIFGLGPSVVLHNRNALQKTVVYSYV